MKIIKFGAKWCGPCWAYAPVFDKWKEWQTNIEVESIDVEEEPTLAGSLWIMSVPTTILFDDDWKDIKRHSWPMDEEELNNFIR